MKVTDFDYTLPPELIAQHPAEQRDASRLMVVNRRTRSIVHSRFVDILEFLEPGDVLVVNNTKVIPARLHGRKQQTGGKVEIFLLRNLNETTWDVLIGGKVKPGTRLEFGAGEVSGTVRQKGKQGRGVVEFDPQANLKDQLYALGNVPLPPYIKRPDGVLSADQQRYQTVYAQQEGAVAAPTAGLHFSEPLLDAITSHGVERITVTLHVGIGTFQPVSVAQVEEHTIMPEWYDISVHAAERLNAALEQQRRIIAVGTTSTRLLEAVYAEHGAIKAGSGWADIFIYPGFRFQVVQALITNFHLPKSSLLMLVSAFGGMELLRKAYQKAIAEKYRFYSYGDAMLIL